MHAHRSAGFALLELVIVMIIVGIITVSAVYYQFDDTTSLDSQTQQLIRDLRYVQTLSMTRGQRYQLSISTTSYTLSSATPPTTPVIHPGSGSSTVNFTAGITMSSNNLPTNLIIFDGRGLPYSNLVTPLTTNGSIILQAPSGQTRTITINRFTGMIS